MAQAPKNKPKRDAKGRLLKGEKLNPTGKGGEQPRKITQDLREMIREALDQAGGVDYLVEQARKNPSVFIPLVSKILPQEHKVSYELGDKLVEMLNERRNQLADMRGETIDVTPAE